LPAGTGTGTGSGTDTRPRARHGTARHGTHMLAHDPEGRCMTRARLAFGSLLAAVALAACASAPAPARPASTAAGDTAPGVTATGGRPTASAGATRAAARPRVVLRRIRMPDGNRVTLARFRGPVRYVLHSGSQDPGTAALAVVRAGPRVGHRERRRLLAAFNGGFKLSAGVGGYEQEGHVFSRLRNGLASLVIGRSGQASIGVWGAGVPRPGEPVFSVRQNLTLLVARGRIRPAARHWARWGATITGREFVARSALGENSAGNLIYAGSMSASPADLAAALVHAGARIAMELDINPEWVQLDTARKAGGRLRAAIGGVATSSRWPPRRSAASRGPGRNRSGSRRSTLAGLVLAVLAASGVLLTGCAAGSMAPRPAARGPSSGAPRTSASATPARAPTPARHRHSPSTRPVAPRAGRRPQTRASPSAHTAAFHAAMTDLWAAVRADRPRLGRPAFFPLAAYAQVKAIPAPRADWHNRLYADFRLDVAAAHHLLGATARRATLVRVIAPAAQAIWIVPGVCFNSVGYWHVAGARIVYRAGGRIRSFGIASLISWRGVWYVVHLGAVLRAAAVGEVDQPAAGAGVTGPPGGC
jgi:hypothetical protein